MTQFEDRAAEILAAARKLPAGERVAFVRERCEGDDALRAEVESLLEWSTDTGSFLETSALDELSRDLEAPEQPASIGPYRVVDRIGEGGFGVVYLATAESPTRNVAIKVLHREVTPRDALQRFLSEREVQAALDHPNIARVFDSGETEAGEPYLVMQHVPGPKITDYVEAAGLVFEDRLRLLLPVCDAVQHAHQKGVIHRDIKPSNVIVGGDSEVPLPVVIDFGVARLAADARLIRRTHTAEHTQLGTPQYMSPEQARPSIGPIDTRTDVYGLGALLYEVLTGTAPLDGAAFREALAGDDRSQLQRIICEMEPEAPSRRMRGEGTAESRSRVRAELDWIVLKCLAKEPDRRYASPLDLARDLQRFLDNEPVAARPQSNWYRLTKLIRRNRAAFTATVILFAVLLVGVPILAAAYSSERRARLELAEQVVRASAFSVSLRELVVSVRPSISRGADTTLMRVVLDNAAKRADEELSDHPLVEAEVRDALGHSYQDLRQHTKAEANFRRRLEIVREQFEPPHWQIAVALHNLGMAVDHQGDHEQAMALLRESLAMFRELKQPDDKGLALAMSQLAMVVQAHGDRSEARQLLEDARAIWVQHDDRNLHHEYAQCLDNLAAMQADPQVAAALYREAFEINRTALGEDHAFTISAANNLGLFLLMQNELEQANELLTEALRLRRKTYPADDWLIAQSARNLALVTSQQEDYERTHELLAAALRGHEPSEHLNDEMLAMVQTDLARVLIKLKRLDDANEQLDAAEERYLRTGWDRHPSYVKQLRARAQHARALGQLEDALPILQSAIDLAGALQPGSVVRASCVIDLAEVLIEVGRDEQAAEALASIADTRFEPPVYASAEQRLAEALATLERRARRRTGGDE